MESGRSFRRICDNGCAIWLPSVENESDPRSRFNQSLTRGCYFRFSSFGSPRNKALLVSGSPNRFAINVFVYPTGEQSLRIGILQIESTTPSKWQEGEKENSRNSWNQRGVGERGWSLKKYKTLTHFHSSVSSHTQR